MRFFFLTLLFVLSLFVSSIAIAQALKLEFIGGWEEREISVVQKEYQNLPRTVRLTIEAGKSPLGLVKTTLVNLPENIFGRYLVVRGGNFLTQVRLAFFREFDRLGSFSASSSWQRISGWNSWRPLGLPFLKFIEYPYNQDPRAFAHSKVPSSARGDFVTSLNLFLYEPQKDLTFKCRNSRKFQYLKKILEVEPQKWGSVRCSSMEDGFLDDIEFIDPVDKSIVPMGRFSLEMIEGFELLYATPGTADFAEVAGHLLLRVKMTNNPLAKKLGMENPNDLVLSFLADTADATASPSSSSQVPPRCEDRFLDFLPTSDPNFDPVASLMQALKGLSGGFLTTFDRNSLAATVHSYTIVQNRNLYRYRLNLTPEQKESLARYFFEVKQNFRTPYYFFDRNCASVLINVLGKGIQDREIEEFDSMVLPPNALIALLVRRGYATPVYPAFYGEKRRAHSASDLIQKRISSLQEFEPNLEVSSTLLNSSSPETRLRMFDQIAQLEIRGRRFLPYLVDIALLVGESELEFFERNDPCSSRSTLLSRRAREFLSNISLNEPELVQRRARALDDELQAHLVDTHRSVDEVGSDHTRLQAYGFGLSNNSLYLRLSLYKQGFGDLSKYRMQQNTKVTLGEFTLLPDKEDRVLKGWSMKGLDLIKFRVNPLLHVQKRLAPHSQLLFNYQLFFVHDFKHIADISA